MALTVEDGTGVVGADSYAAVATADTYWTNRTNQSLSTTWSGATTAVKEGALREATAFLDAVFGPYYRGHRKSSEQGLLWPRSEAYEADNYPLPDLPQQIVDATCDLAARAISARLASDDERGGMVKSTREKVDVISTEVTYADGAPRWKTYGYIEGMLALVLNGLQPNAPSPHWNWI